MPKKTKSEIATLPNLGQASAKMLAHAGINTAEQLRDCGSISAYLQTIAITQKPNLNLLYAIEGALSGEHWQDVAKHDKLRLLIELDAASDHHPDTKKAE